MIHTLHTMHNGGMIMDNQYKISPWMQPLLKRELAPCPFCGTAATLVPDKQWDGSILWGIACETPDCFTNATRSAYETPEEAVAAWNQRYEIGRLSTDG